MSQALRSGWAYLFDLSVELVVSQSIEWACTSYIDHNEAVDLRILLLIEATICQRHLGGVFSACSAYKEIR